MNLKQQERRPQILGWNHVGALLAGVAALTVIHAYLVVPRLIIEARVEWREDIDDAVAPVRESLREVKTRQVRIEDKIDRLSTK